MKRFIKRIYMLINHPYLFFLTFEKNFFVKRGGIIKKGKQIIVGNNVSIGYDSRIQFYDNGKLMLGDETYICNRCTFLVGGNICFGKKVLVASDVLFCSESHSIDPENKLYYLEQKLKTGKIYIGDGTWIGEKSIILPNTVIGKKCIIGAGSVVTHNIPDYSIAVGNPAKVIKKYNFDTHLWEKSNG